MRTQGDEPLESVWRHLDPQQLLADTYRFVNIASPTGEEEAFAGEFAPYLETMGFPEVEIDREFPSSPSVVARLQSSAAKTGPTLQLDGHSDAIVIPHKPPRLDQEAGIVYGRGAADMKGGLVAMAHAVRAIRAAGLSLRGKLLFTVHGLHEAPGGDQRTLRSLLKRGVAGDAALIAELSHDSVPIASRGMSIFRFSIQRPDGVMHEVELTDRARNPIGVGSQLLRELEGLARAAEVRNDETLGSESLFLGQIHGGDFYNRVPESLEVEGTRRYLPPWTNEDIEAELAGIAAELQAASNMRVELHVQPVAAPYRLEADEAIVRAACTGVFKATGRMPPLSGANAVGNAADFAAAGVPAVYHGVNQATAHSDREYVRVEDLLRAARVYVATIIEFCNGEE